MEQMNLNGFFADKKGKRKGYRGAIILMEKESVGNNSEIIPDLVEMNPKYILDSAENKEFLASEARKLLEFGRKYPSPGGGSYYLGSDGTPMKEKNRETWITSRMVHVYSIGAMLGFKGAAEFAVAGLQGLLKGELRDSKNGGWFAGVSEDKSLPNKQCYAHAFVILAASSALLAGRAVKKVGEDVSSEKQTSKLEVSALALLQDALQLFDTYFWNEEEGMTCDTWDTAFSELDDYRGLNANMHTVEAFLAAADALGEEKYRVRAGRIIDRVLKFADEFDYRIPEHYTREWVPVPDMNRDRPDDPFKPYGATPGHGIEWARLIAQWAVSTYFVRNNEDEINPDLQLKYLQSDTQLHLRDLSDRPNYERFLQAACKLYERAVSDGWNADGEPGIVYTTDWDGKPVVRDRMHWTLAEAINTSAVLYRLTGNEKYAADYAAFMQYLDEKVLDHEKGSWFHQLDETNRLKETVWPGKPDIYHAFQAMLIPYARPELSIAAAVSEYEK